MLKFSKWPYDTILKPQTKHTLSMKFGKKQPLHRYLHSKLGIALLLVIMVLFGRGAYERYTIERDMADRLTEAEKELQELQTRKSSLEANVEYLEGERGIEEEIRSNFDVARQGEQVVILTGEEPTTTAPEPEPLPPPPWWQFWR